MTANTKIEWADSTFNPWIGCTKISAACDNCYAADQAARFKMADWGPHAPRKRTSTKNWREPLKWNREADAFEAKHGRPRFVFCASMADVFDNAVDPKWRSDLFDTISHCNRLIWLILTKRPQNISTMLPSDWGDGWPHVWLGTTVENQEAALRNIPALQSAPAAKRFLSCEPLLGPLDLVNIAVDDDASFSALCSASWEKEVERWRDSGDPHWRSEFEDFHGRSPAAAMGEMWPAIDWVIAGGESGRHARPMHPDWARSLRDQCEAADVPFFFKQWGEWIPWEFTAPPLVESQNGRSEDRHGFFPANMDDDRRWDDGLSFIADGHEHFVFERVGKAMAGRKLDGVEHNGRPFVPPKIKLPQPAFKTGLIGDVT